MYGNWWRERPGAEDWKAEVDAADAVRGPGVPLEELPQFVESQRASVRLVSLLHFGPPEPGVLKEARSLSRRLTGLLPQPGPDLYCYQERWKSRDREQRLGALVCSRRTCGRCLPLKAALERGGLAG
ncbi:hypothetical protein ABT354_35860 [Streptomyces sp. NPDC000594]|uniref:hypothetical protein n=1 Tax=Streptomyces sp. NPDC000594 TaxID=3154261 RepID=UPI00332EFCF9